MTLAAEPKMAPESLPRWQCAAGRAQSVADAEHAPDHARRRRTRQLRRWAKHQAPGPAAGRRRAGMAAGWRGRQADLAGAGQMPGASHLQPASL